MKNLLVLPLLTSMVAFGQSFVPDAPELDLKSYILIEPNTNTVIAEFNSSSEIDFTQTICPTQSRNHPKIPASYCDFDFSII